MKLIDLVKGVKIKKIIGDKTVNVKDVCANSTLVQNGSLFICLSGNTFDGHGFINQAESYGAVAVITEKEVKTTLTQVLVEDARQTMCVVASNFYGNPSNKMKIIGVTGTNGKTTTTHIIKKILDGAGIKCGVIGTLGTYYGDVYIEPTLTTPDPIALHKILNDMYKNGVKVVAMEVSAHALYYDKVFGINFEVGVLTNFTQDHLDFFKNMDEYKKAKKKLFTNSRSKFCVINADDEFGASLINGKGKFISYGIENPSDVFAIDVKSAVSGNDFVINLFDVVFEVKLGLIGRFNVYNALSAGTAAALVGTPIEKIKVGLNGLKTIDGRLEKVFDGDFCVYVDYAHTPDGLYKTLFALKEVCKGKLICVFGCGGNRDGDKREIMGEISGNLSDFTVITSDNPRFEEPMDIIREIEKGMLKVSKNYVVVQDRAEGISYALNLAKKNDIVLVAGKGSERYQEILGIKHDFYDKDIIIELIGGLS